MTCALCEKVALYRAGEKGYCKDHRAEAVKKAKHWNSDIEQRHHLDYIGYQLDRRDRTEQRRRLGIASIRDQEVHCSNPRAKRLAVEIHGLGYRKRPSEF